MEQINQYLEIIREIIVKISMKDNNLMEFNEMMQKQLRIDKNKIEIILVSLDIIGDTQEAINNFLQYGLKEEVGEKYIRLYGLLNAIYLHSQAVVSLGKYFNVKNITDMEKFLNSKIILDVRHKLGAHSVNYENLDKTISCYTPIRMLMEASTLVFYNMNPQSTESETINLYDEIHKYILYAKNIIKETVVKLSTTIYKTAPNKLQQINKKIVQIEISKVN
ncbi:hypothetical protein MLC52_04900 [Sulfurimonas sp. NW15]|uniref:hypothetical protein n=1 Tax=Sulfurimonas sp. NW15 TaxID=2922729 RepID=UPI003DA8FDD6